MKLFLQADLLTLDIFYSEVQMIQKEKLLQPMKMMKEK